MAEYTCTTRTNYFHVTDADAFMDIMSQVCGREEPVSVWDDKDANGKTIYAFGCTGVIDGYPISGEGDDIEYDYDEFIDDLKKLIPDGEAIIIFEAGHEKLRYIKETALVLTNKDEKNLDLRQLAIATAGELLQNPSFETRCVY